MRVGGGEALCQIGSHGGSGGAHARWGLRAGGLRGEHGEGDRARGGGSVPGIPEPPGPPLPPCPPHTAASLPLQPSGHVWCPRLRGEGPTHGVLVPAAAPAACRCRCHLPAPPAGVRLGVSPCQRALGAFVAAQAVGMWQGGRVPGLGSVARAVWWPCWD